jgi:hypothetical protein
MGTAKARRAPRREYFALLGKQQGKGLRTPVLQLYFADISLKS